MTMQRDQALEQTPVRRTAMAIAWDDTRHKVPSRLMAKEGKMTGHKIMEDIAGRDGREDRAGGRIRQRWPLQVTRRITGRIGEGSGQMKHQQEMKDFSLY